jgi:butyrate kinase
MSDLFILAINPGSTSTKVGVFRNEIMIHSNLIEHQAEQLDQFTSVYGQFEMRKLTIEKCIESIDFDMKKLSAVVGRGGLLPPVHSGGYLVNRDMTELIWEGQLSEHASNLGALLADAIAKPLNIPAYVYDGVSSDEMDEIARITGFPEIERKSYCHVLNSKAVARKYARICGKKYEEMNLVVAHLGSGISISAHKNGKIIDVLSDDSGPFSPERSGSVPLFQFADLVYSNQYEKKELYRKIRGKGGLKGHLGTGDCREIERRISDGDEKAKKIYAAQAYQIAKGVGEMAVVFKEKIDGIILTGGMAFSEKLIMMISDYIRFIGPIQCFPGENELEALALGTLRILKGEEKAHKFIR